MLTNPKFSNSSEEWTKVSADIEVAVQIDCEDCPADDSYWCDLCCMNEEDNDD